MSLRNLVNQKQNLESKDNINESLKNYLKINYDK